MLDLYQELEALIRKLNEREIDYALCGGLAVAVYAAPRATVDIDLLVPPESLEAALAAARELGFTIEAMPMNFGPTKIRRITKLESGGPDYLILDLILVTPELADVWQSRSRRKVVGGEVWVVSPEGLIKMKQSRGSDIDLVDIRRLKEAGDEERS